MQKSQLCEGGLEAFDDFGGDDVGMRKIARVHLSYWALLRTKLRFGLPGGFAVNFEWNSHLRKIKGLTMSGLRVTP